MSQIAAKPTLAPPESRPGREPALVELVDGPLLGASIPRV